MLCQLVFVLSLNVFFFNAIELPPSNLSLCANDSTIIVIKKSSDFDITGNGNAENWERTEWVNIHQRRFSNEKQMLSTKVKILYSELGIYFLFKCEDKKLTTSMNDDFMDLWKEDVVEVFLWPDENTPAYFEYEISPLNFELPILVSNQSGDIVRWKPFHYEADRRTIHATSVQGGKRKSDAKISMWMAEFFIPYKLLRPLKNILPKSGTQWRANLYRMDYDNGPLSWSWQLTDKSFHDYKKFGYFVFE